VATYAIDTYQVNASVTGGHGSATPSTQTINYNESATITLTPEAHYHLATLTDNGNPVTPLPSGSYVISNVAAAHTVVATYAIDTYTVSASVTGGHGTATPATQTINYNNSATVTLTPEAHYHLATLTDNGNPVTPLPTGSYVISNVAAAHTVVATYAIDAYTVSASVTGGHGTATPGTQPINYGESATITLTPEAHYHLATLTDNGNPVTPLPTGSYVISNVAAAHTVVATYAIDTYQVNASVTGGHGTVVPSEQTVEHGATVQFTLIPDVGYHPLAVSNGTISRLPEGGYQWSISGVVSPLTATVSFNINQYRVTAAVSTGYGSVTPAERLIDHGGAAVFVLRPDSGYYLLSVSEGTTAANPDGSITWTIASVTHDGTILALFSPRGDINGDGQITVEDLSLCIHMASGSVMPNFAAADINQDGIVDIRDIYLLRRKLQTTP